MKRISLLFFLSAIIAVFSASAVLGQAEEILKDGNNAFSRKDYEMAKEKYEELLGKGYESSTLFYNLGNTYYRLGRIGYAILYYEKALRLSPGDEDAAYNLRVARAHTIDRLDMLPDFPLVKYYRSLAGSLSVNGWTAVASILYLSAVLLSAVLILNKGRKVRKYLLSIVASSVILMMISAGILYQRIEQEKSDKYVIIVEPAISIKTSPDMDSKDAFLLHEGTKVRLKDRVQDWMLVVLDDGKSGWLHTKDAQVI